MSATADHFASIDSQLTAARAAWEEDRKALEQRILELDTELRLTRAALDAAAKSRDNALHTTAKLLTQFGIVATVFEEAKQLAINSGLYSESTSSDVESNKAKIDAISEVVSDASVPNN